MKVKKAVFVVAGFGTRFLPVTKTVPKEMLPIISKPTIHYVVEEALKAGITDLIFIVSRNKKAIEDYLDDTPELEALLARNGKAELLKAAKKITENANVFFVRQPGPLGTGDAVLRAEPIIGDEPFVVLYPDDIFFSEEPFTQQLIDIHEETGASVIGLEEIPREKVSAYGVVNPGKIKGGKVEINGFVEKPKVEEAPSNFVVWGRYLLTPAIFDFLRQIEPAANGEYQLTDALELLLKKEKVYGKVFKGHHFDTGNKIGYLKANLFEAYNDPQIREELEAFLEELKEKTDAVRV